MICASEAAEALALDLVELVPVGQAPHREVPDDPGGDLRARLCEAAVSGDERLAVSRVEVERPGPSYTADTLRALRERRPDDEPFLVLGSDQAMRIPAWHRPEDVLALATLAVTTRSGASRDDVRARVGEVGDPDAIRFFDMPLVDVSSTLVRRRVAAGESIRYLVPDPVAALVAEHGLYRTAVEAG